MGDRRALLRLGPGDPVGDGKTRMPATGRTVGFSTARNGTRLWLDGNQYDGSVLTAPNPALAGVRWSLEARPDGSWRLKNQGALSYGLIANGTGLRLGTLSPDQGHDDPMADWLIYRSPRAEGLLMRPKGAAWLATGADASVHLTRDTSGRTANCTWTIEIL